MTDTWTARLDGTLNDSELRGKAGETPLEG